ncbi:MULTISPECIES: Rv2175c family DNA-binding protein [unclassified Isoptericola]|uniref:Rv2175c family DNA-binding protein n=1 Tax=unclassified Isoptericola TaxID=2623355 RepID=UPI0027142A39|nr:MULTISPECIES: Rv2175c family DNA-binding protein [unclassified Isoptericola]MDO8145198.1 Rv2175c family DNA-binding protein [Isoptericola sp. 178]MDO8148836.1 Rv2175c family DNA-binding protein [Isoptericola sp. b515]MDO8151222.1 Rv2175c family DNA-binding protein [Isoptericola sp. b408]
MSDAPEQTPLDDLVGDWLTLPDLADAVGTDVSKVRGMVSSRHVIGVKRGERTTFQVPAAFVVETSDGGATVLETLRGTLILLGDAGYSDAEALRWLFTEDSTLGTTPVGALRAGRRAQVRRLAQALG